MFVNAMTMIAAGKKRRRIELRTSIVITKPHPALTLDFAYRLALRGRAGALSRTEQSCPISRNTIRARLIPSFTKEGWLRHKEQRPRSLVGADGVVVSSHRLSKPFGMNKR